MRLISLIILLLVAGPVHAEENVSVKTFPPVVLANHLVGGEAIDGGDIGCGFLLRYRGHVYAVTAKHILRLLQNRRAQLAPNVTAWSMFSKADPQAKVKLGPLLNEDPAEMLGSKASGRNDWLVFELASNATRVEPLELRALPLRPGEKVYVVGWTRHQTQGPQRVYEWRYVKTVDTRLLLEPLIVPPTLGGLSGAPVLDSEGRVVGLVSNETTDPTDGKKYFSPCCLDQLRIFLEKLTR